MLLILAIILVATIYIIVLPALAAIIIFNTYIMCLIYKKSGGNFLVTLIPLYGIYKFSKRFNVNKKIVVLYLCNTCVTLTIIILPELRGIFEKYLLLIVTIKCFISIVFMVGLKDSIRLSFRKDKKSMNEVNFWIGDIFCLQSIVALAINKNYKYVYGKNKEALLYEEFSYDFNLLTENNEVDVPRTNNTSDLYNKDMNEKVRYKSILYWYASILTYGIAQLIWFYILFNKVRKLDENLMHPGFALLLGFLSCGVYIHIYIYKALNILEKNGYEMQKSYKIASIFLSIFWLNIINLYHMQNFIDEKFDPKL